MINTVAFMGILKNSDPIKPQVRWIEVQRDFKNAVGKFVVDLIPTMYWTKGAKTILHSLDTDMLCGFRGHFETDEGQVVIVIEQIDTIGMNLHPLVI